MRMVWRRKVAAMSEWNGGPAFPAIDNWRLDSGMSLRDYFAAKALEALILKEKDYANRGRDAVPKLAVWAYEYADAMLAERDKP